MDVSLLKTLYMDNMKLQGILPTREIEQLFGNLEELHDAVDRFFTDLHDEMGSKALHQVSIATVILKPAHSFKELGTFVQNNAVTLDYLRNFIKRPNFNDFVNSMHNLPECNKLSLEDFLAKPVQRLCKYPLLLKSILEFTAVEQVEERQRIEKALEKIQKVVKIVNENKGIQEKLRESLAVQNSFVQSESDSAASLPYKDRLLTKSGKVKKVTVNSTDLKGKMMFLFSDVLVFAKKRDKFFVLQLVLPINNLIIWEVPKKSPLDKQFGFQIVRSDVQQTIIVCCESAESRTQWFALISEAIGSFLLGR